MSPDASSGGLLAVANDIRRAASERDPWATGLRLVGIGWGTVELERAAEELSRAFASARLPAPDWAPATRDAHLGAAAWVGTASWFGAEGPPRGLTDPELPAVVLLEPDSEGRLAATLARFDEGVAAIYLEAPWAGAAAAAGSAGSEATPYPLDRTRVGAPAPGPLGLARMVLARPAWGPHVLVVAGAPPVTR
jgi:hypothetical protein